MKVVIKNKKAGRFVGFTILVALSIGFSYLAFNLYIDQSNFVKVSSVSDGKVVSLTQNRDSKNHVTYSPVVEYLAKEGEIRTFTSSLSGNPSPHNIGEKVSILIPNNGNPPKINSFMDLWFGFIIVCFFAIVFISILILSIYIKIRGSQIDDLLKSRGVIVKAKVVSVDESTYSRNTTLTYLIKAQWLNPQNNEVFVFESEDFTYNPKEFLGENIDVKILPEDPRTYEMDISGLPVAGN